MKREQLKKIIRECITELKEQSESKRTYYAVSQTDLSLGSRDPDAEQEYVWNVVLVTTDGDGLYEEGIVQYDLGSKESAQKVADRFNLEKKSKESQTDSGEPDKDDGSEGWGDPDFTQHS